MGGDPCGDLGGTSVGLSLCLFFPLSTRDCETCSAKSSRVTWSSGLTTPMVLIAFFKASAVDSKAFSFCCAFITMLAASFKSIWSKIACMLAGIVPVSCSKNWAITRASSDADEVLTVGVFVRDICCGNGLVGCYDNPLLSLYAWSISSEFSKLFSGSHESSLME